ncbi:MAG TPA: hypothetical protein PK829_07275 [Promineifilum sp.]|nr:hypothetical protein [Promineifilum sp.]
MISYRVRRLHAPGEAARRYHLFDRADQLLLVADQGSAWLPNDGTPQVRFARPDGERVATMDLPRPADRRPEKQHNYAIIYEHAVYALITAPIRPPSGAAAPLSAAGSIVWPFTRLLIEVEGHRWLALRWPEGAGPLLVLYDAGNDGVSLSADPESSDLPEPLGLLEVGTGDYDFDLTLPAGRLEQGPLLALALVYLLDQAGK